MMREPTRTVAHSLQQTIPDSGSRYGYAQKSANPPAWVRQIVADCILEDAAEFCSRTTADEVFSDMRHVRIVRVRWAAMRRTRAILLERDGPDAFVWSKMGRWFGRHHTGVMHACGATAK